MTEPNIRIALIALGAVNLALGLLMAISPHTFFDQIGDYGTENDHYIGDVAAFYLAAGAGLLLSASRPSWRVPVCVIAALWYGFHALNHLTDLGLARTESRGIADTVLLALGALAFAYLAREADRQ